MDGKISRRAVLQTGGGAVAAAAGLVGPPILPGLAAPKSKRGDRPNVLFIAIDDMNDWTGYLGGYPGAQTPNLDRLAKLVGGFTRAYTPAAACKPARASILFSALPSSTGIYTNGSADWFRTSLADRLSLPRFFRDAGYDTIGTGKVFHGWNPQRDNPAANDPKAWTDYEFVAKTYGGSGGGVTFGAEGRTDDTEDVLRAEWLAKNVLSKTNDKPFFAAFGLRKPHLPWRVPQEWFDRYPIENLVYPLGAQDVEHTGLGDNKDVQDLSDAGRALIEQHVADHRKIISGPGWKAAVQGYLAAISFADHALGVVLDALLKGPNASNTIICLWSDHGWQLGEKLAWRKFTLWERATRVPLLLGGPGLRNGPQDAVISSLDLYPTLAELAVGEAPGELEGVSFAPFLRGRGEEPRDHALSSWALDLEDGGGRGKDVDLHFAVRSKTHRLIVYSDGSRELYDHRNDPWEWKNLLARKNTESGDESVAKDLARYVPKNPKPLINGSGDGGDD